MCFSYGNVRWFITRLIFAIIWSIFWAFISRNSDWKAFKTVLKALLNLLQAPAASLDKTVYFSLLPGFLSWVLFPSSRFQTHDKTAAAQWENARAQTWLHCREKKSQNNWTPRGWINAYSSLMWKNCVAKWLFSVRPWIWFLLFLPFDKDCKVDTRLHEIKYSTAS